MTDCACNPWCVRYAGHIGGCSPTPLERDLPDQGKPAPHPFGVPTAGDFHCGRCGTLLDGGTDEPVAARELRAENERLRDALRQLSSSARSSRLPAMSTALVYDVAESALSSDEIGASDV